MANEKSSDLTTDSQLLAATSGFESVFNDDLDHAIKICPTPSRIPYHMPIFLRRLLVLALISYRRLVTLSSDGTRRRVLLTSCTWDGGMNS